VSKTICLLILCANFFRIEDVSNQFWYQRGGTPGATDKVSLSILSLSPLNIFQDLMEAGRKCLGAPNAIERKIKQPELIIVILPQSAADLRAAVKHFGDVTMGVQTQCIVSGICLRVLIDLNL
jgi:hypothetical protein